MAEQATVLDFAVQAREKLAFVMADAKEELMFLTAAGRAYTLTTDGATRGASQLPNLSFAADLQRHRRIVSFMRGLQLRKLPLPPPIQ